MNNRNEKFIPLTNDFMFSLVMKDPEICMEFLKLVLPEKDFTDIKIMNSKIEELSGEINTQSVLKFAELAKGVRFDVYVKSENTWAEIEMQAYTDNTLPQRSRYYQANMDIDALNKGKSYEKLPIGYVIFLCTYDFIGKDCPIYYFENIEKNLGLPFGDKTYKIVLNTKCSPEKVPEKLKPLYRYLNNPGTENPDRFIKKLDEQVKKYNNNEWRHTLMTLEDLIRIRYNAALEKGIELGITQGIAQGMEQGIAQGMEQGIAQGMEQGIAQGMEQGIAQGMEQGITQHAKETAYNMYIKGYTEDAISDVLNVDLDIVKGWI